MGDPVTPLATPAQLIEGPFGDLVRAWSPTALADLLVEATRGCESACDRRLAPFSGLTETQRAEALDVEDALDAYVPLDPTSQLGFSRAQSLGSTLLVRHFWVRHHPPRYPDLWSGSVTSVNLFRSYSGQQTVNAATIQFEPDTGHTRFQLGTFVPPGTTIQVVYSGGYATTPADLARACKLMAAALAVRELAPVENAHGHDPGALEAQALEWLTPYVRR